jgi:hypothetical protein
MSDEAAANLYLVIGLTGTAGVIADAALYPRWWILVPLAAVLVADILWGIWETQ